MRSIAKLLGIRAQDLAADRRGALLLFVAFAVIPLFGALGLAVDAARGYMVKEKLSRAIDVAALAGARTIDAPDLAFEVQKYFSANFPPGYMNAVVTGPDFQVSDDDRVLTVTAHAHMGTSFMSVLGFDAFDISSSAEATRSSNPLDVVLAMDMSGSMAQSAGRGGQSRIAAARVAALSLVDMLYGRSEERPDLELGIVPWNEKVNVTVGGRSYHGSEARPVDGFTNPITGLPQSEVYLADNSPVPLLFEPPADWRGCVFARYVDDGIDSNDADTAYGTGTFDNLDWPGWEPTGVDTSGGGRSRDRRGGGRVDQGNCLEHGITPLQRSRSAVVDAINSMTRPQGYTNIPQGLAWAWRVLMPDAPFVEADPDPEVPINRVIILLTDGENCGGPIDAYKEAFGGCDAARAEYDGRLRQIAAKVKAQGVSIIAIQFANGGTAQQALMKEIASKPMAPYYYYAPDGATLNQIFKQIGNELIGLRLSR